MAIARNALLASTATSSPGTSTTTASVTNTANALLLLAVCSGDTGGAPAAPTSVTGLGLTWVQVNSASVGNLAMSVWRALGSSSTGGITINWATGTDSAIYQLDEFTGVNTTGTNGSGAVPQSNTSAANTSTPTVTLSSTPATDSATYGAVNHNDTSQTASAGSGFTLLGAGTTTVGGPSQHQAVEWDNTPPNGTGIAFSWSGAGNAPMVGLEIAALQGQTISPTGIASAGAFGSDVVAGPITATGIASAMAFGTATVAVGLQISGAGGIGSSESFGRPMVLLHSGPVPQLIFEAAFPNSPFEADANVTWTDLTTTCRRLSTRRGRSRELDRFNAGTLDADLDNRDRSYEPENPGSAYYPNIVPNRRVRVRASAGGVVYPVMSAYADGWDQSYTMPNDATCRLTASDAFKLLARSELPAAWDKVLATITPSSRYRLDEQAGTTVADAAGSKPGTYVGSVSLNAARVAQGTDGSAVTFSGDGTQYATVNPSPLPTSSSTTAITFRAATAVYNGSNVGSFAASKPGGTLQNDVMLAAVAIEADATAASAPSGWTLLRTDVTATTDTDGCRLYTYYKAAGASEASSYTWTFSKNTHVAVTITSWAGVSTSSPVDVSGGQTNDSASATTCTAPSVTTTVANAMLVTHHAFNPASTSIITASQTPPSGMTERADTASVTSSGGSNRATIEACSLALTAAGATGAKVSTLDVNNGRNVGHAIALRPSSSGSSVPTPFTVAFWEKASANQAAGDSFILTAGTNYLEVYQNPTGSVKMRARLVSAGVTIGEVEADTAPPLNANNLVIVRYDGATTLKIDASFASSQTVLTAMGALVSLSPETFNFGLCAGTLDELVVWQRSLTDTEVASLEAVAAGVTTTTALMAELLDYATWPTDLRSIQGTGKTCSTLTSVADPGTKLLDFAQGVNTTERGALYVNKSGAITFESYVYKLTDPSRTTSTVTFGSGVGEIPYRAIAIPFNDREVINEVTITNTTTNNGTASAYTEDYSAADAQSILDNGRKTLSLNLNLDGTSSARASALADRANYELDLNKQARREIVGLTVGGFSDPTHWASVLGLDLMSRVRVNHVTPAGATISQDLTVEGISYSMTPGDWTCTLALSSGGQRHTYWNLGEAGFSELGVTTWLG